MQAIQMNLGCQALDCFEQQAYLDSLCLHKKYECSISIVRDADYPLIL